MKILNENSLWSRDEKLIYDGISKLVWTDVGKQGCIPYVSVMEGTECRTVLEIPIYSGTRIPIDSIVKVDLILTAVTDMSNQYIRVGTTDLFYITLNAGEKLYVDITDYYRSAVKSGESFCELPISSPGVYMSVIPPQFERDVFVEYTFSPDKLWNEAKTDVDVAGTLLATHNMLDGTIKTVLPIVNSEDSILGQAITYAIDSNGSTHLSIDESLEIKGTENSEKYFHTDTLGDTYGVTQYFYYDTNGQKTYLYESKSKITIKLDGTLEYEGHRVYPEFTTRTGIELLPTPKGYKGGENFETRSDELREVEEQIANYKEALSEYVIVQKDAVNNTLREDFGVQFRDFIDNPQNQEEFIQSAWDENNLLLTKSEAISYESACLQLQTLEIQKEMYTNNKDAESDSLIQCCEQLENIEEQMEQLVNQRPKLVSKHVENYNLVKRTLENKAFYVDENDYYTEAVNDFESNNAPSGYNGDANYYHNIIGAKNSTQQQILACENTLNEFVLLDKTNEGNWINDSGEFINDRSALGNIVADFTSWYPSASSMQFYIATKTDALNYLSINMQISQLQEQKARLTTQKEKLEISTTIAGVNHQFVADIERQKSAIALQKATYISYQDKVIEEFERKVKEYGILLQRLNEIKQYEIVATIKDGDVLKGFNENGQIVLVSDLKGEKQARYEYENGKVARLYDEDGNEVRFDYDSDNRIKVITDAKGKKTTYSYANGITVTHSNGVKITFTISGGKLIKVTNGYTGLATAFEYADGKVSKITQRSGSNELSASTFTYGVDGNNVTILVENTDTTRTRYVIRPDMEIVSKLTEKAGKMIEAVRYEGGYLNRVNDFDFDNEEYVLETYSYHKNDLIGASLDSFTFDDEKCTFEKIYPDVTRDNQPEYVYVSNHEDTNVEYQEVFYTYDEKRRLVDEKNVIVIKSPASTFTSHTLYSYDNNGVLVKEVSYVEGEESTYGKNVTEYEYSEDDRVKKVSYNTLQSSDKIYEESIYDKKGLKLCDFDVTGTHKIEYAYNADTSVREITLPNGTKLAYGYDSYGNVTSISQSTLDGIENSTDRTYSAGKIVELRSGNNKVNYTYDGKQRVREVNVNGSLAAYHTYNEIASLTVPKGESTITYSNVDKENVTRGFSSYTSYKGKDGKLLKEEVGGCDLNYEYDDNDNVTKVDDTFHIRTDSYEYDDNNRLTNYSRYYIETENYTENITYDSFGNVNTISNSENQAYSYTYKDDSTRQLEKTQIFGYGIYPRTDCNGRNIGKEILCEGSPCHAEKIDYLKVGDHTTNFPSRITYANNDSAALGNITMTLKYSYDNMGNVSKIYKNGLLTTRYTYDGLNRLIREDNRDFGKTYRIDYDDKGNITGKYTYDFTLCSMDDLYEKTPTATQTYEYDLQSDRLHAINGNIIGYDMYGFPSRYGLDGQFCTWYDNYLSGFGSNTFVRDNRGRRIYKNNILFIYDSQDRLIKQSNGVEFFYDHTGVAGISYNGTLYTYEKDIFGNVISILDRDGRRVVQYVYDAWGNHKIVDGYGNTITSSTHIGIINPIRYRSYYYDTETGLYYLQARYYDPVIGRFISPDDVDYIDPEAINGLNLYAYCGNNPVMNIDPTGHDFWSWLLGGLLVIGVTILTAGIAGAAAWAIGATYASIKAVAIGSIVSGLIAGGTNLVVQGITSNWQTVDYGSLALSSFVGAASGAISAGFGQLSKGVTYGAKLLAHKGAQVAVNTLTSWGGYVFSSAVSGKELTLDGFIRATLGGFIAGIGFNWSKPITLGFTIGLEISGYVHDIIKFFGNNFIKKTNSEAKWIQGR